MWQKSKGEGRDVSRLRMEMWKQSRGLLEGGAQKTLEKYRDAAHDFLEFPVPPLCVNMPARESMQ